MMKMTAERCVAARFGRWRGALALVCVAFGLAPGNPAARVSATRDGAQSNPNAIAGVTIVLPPRLMAGHPATLAVLGGDGELAPAVTVSLGNGETVTTDRTGRALFTAPASGDYLVAKASGATAAALIDPAVGASEPSTTTLPAIISVRDRFWVCTAGLRGDADANSVKIDNEPALILAASPECLVALPSPKTELDAAVVVIAAPGTQATANATLVALEFEAPQPALLPGKKSRLSVRVRGSEQKLAIVVENETPGVLRFLRGDEQELRTKGGAQNVAELDVQAIRSGDYSFRARLLTAPDAALAQRYLQASAALAPKEMQGELRGYARRLARNPSNTQAVRAAVGRALKQTGSGDLRALLSAAWEAL
jgi:hypothetical protein